MDVWGDVNLLDNLLLFSIMLTRYQRFVVFLVIEVSNNKDFLNFIKWYFYCSF